jgi:hypothetical protein
MKTKDAKHWIISVTGYGSFFFEGTIEEAEEMRAHKADWEGGRGTKRSATPEEIKIKDVIEKK